MKLPSVKLVWCGMAVNNDRLHYWSYLIWTGLVYRLTQERLVVCCSGMSVTEKEQVKQIIGSVGQYLLSDDKLWFHCLPSFCDLGGAFANNWNHSCTHLVMSSVTVTVKVHICCGEPGRDLSTSFSVMTEYKDLCSMLFAYFLVVIN